jgi:hypothetical protein
MDYTNANLLFSYFNGNKGDLTYSITIENKVLKIQLTFSEKNPLIYI